MISIEIQRTYKLNIIFFLYHAQHETMTKKRNEETSQMTDRTEMKFKTKLKKIKIKYKLKLKLIEFMFEDNRITFTCTKCPTTTK